MFYKVIKILQKPDLAISLLFRIVITLLLFPIRCIFYKHIGLLSYVSLKSDIRCHTCISIGNYSQINPFVVLWPTSLIIGHHTQINPGTAIYGKVIIGNYVMIAPNCMVAGGNHNFTNNHHPMLLQGSNEKGIVIEDDVWIGANCTILDGVTIGKGSIIGAGAVVTKSVAAFSVFAGIPAKKIKSRIQV